jgi:hypothetical protein
MSLIKSFVRGTAEALEQIYLQRDHIPYIWKETTKFYAENVWPDLIALGHKVHLAKKSSTPGKIIFATFFPKTAANFDSFNDKMNEYMDEVDQKLNRNNENNNDDNNDDVIEEATLRPVGQQSPVSDYFDIKSKKYIAYNNITK